MGAVDLPMEEEVGEFKMEIENVKRSDGKLNFEIKDASLHLINAIRRTIAENTPILAIDVVEFIKNDSVLYDEIIAHRLGLVPLKTDLKTLKLREECSCKGKGCNKCTIKLKLSVKGREVSSKDLKGKGVEVVYDMPIVKLAPEQELELIAEARLGVGKEHAKFIPGLAWHAYEENERDIFFNIESFGQMSPKEIFLSATSILSKKLKEFGKEIEKL